MKNITVKNVIIGKQYESSENYQEFLKIVNDKKINVYVVQKGKRVNIEKGIYIDILWPSEKDMIVDNWINNNSLVFKLVYKDFSIMFTGDIEEEAEKEEPKAEEEAKPTDESTEDDQNKDQDA